jgi:hypothetical protein
LWELTLQRELLTVGWNTLYIGVTLCGEGTHLTEGLFLPVGEGTHFTGSITVWKELTLQRELLSVGRKSLYRQSVSSCGEGTHFTEGVTVCGEVTHFTEIVTVCGKETHFTEGLLLHVEKELTLQRDCLFLWRRNSLYRRTAPSCGMKLTLQSVCTRF